MELAAGIASAETDKVKYFVALVLMLGTGLVLMKKMRNGKPASRGWTPDSSGKLTHVGTKARLTWSRLRVKWCFWSTTEKGVQLLTKIDQDNVAEFVSSSRSATELDRRGKYKQRAIRSEKMLAQFRDASDKLRSVSPEKRSKKSSALDELSVLGDNDTGYDRRKFKPVAPRSSPGLSSAARASREKILIEKLRDVE